MRKSSNIEISELDLDQIFSGGEVTESRIPRILQIPLNLIDEFPDHPFQVRLDEDMDNLVESVKERGVITSVTLRKKEDGRYETVSGHRRVKACELAGLETVPAEIKDLTRDEAIILMVDSNLQRSTILPSEKAKSYMMRLEVMKRQGQRTDLTSTPVESKLFSRTNEELGKQVVESREQIRRYIRLNELIPDILDMVDEGRIAMRPAVELSYLSETEQENLYEAMDYADATPSHAQAIKMKAYIPEISLAVAFGWEKSEEAKQRENVKDYLCRKKGITLIRIAEWSTEPELADKVLQAFAAADIFIRTDTQADLAIIRHRFFT